MPTDAQLIALAKEVSRHTGYSSGMMGRRMFSSTHLNAHLPGELNALTKNHQWLSASFGESRKDHPQSSEDHLKAIIRKHLYRLAKHKAPFLANYHEEKHPALCRSLKMIDTAYSFFRQDATPLSPEETTQFLQGYRSLVSWVIDESHSHSLQVSDDYLEAPEYLANLKSNMMLLASRRTHEMLEGFLETAGNLFSHMAQYDAPSLQWKDLFSHPRFHTLCIGGKTLRSRHEALKELLPVIEPKADLPI